MIRPFRSFVVYVIGFALAVISNSSGNPFHLCTNVCQNDIKGPGNDNCVICRNVLASISTTKKNAENEYDNDEFLKMDDGDRYYSSKDIKSRAVDSYDMSKKSSKRKWSTNDASQGMSFIRIGRASFKTNDKPTFGYIKNSLLNENIEKVNPFKTKQADSFLRFREPFEVHEKENAFFSIGEEEGQNEKRASSFIRIGKSPESNANGLVSFENIGKSTDDKRTSSFIRIGKSPNKKKRETSILSKSIDDNNNFKKIGKSMATNKERRGSTFLRIGKSPTENKRTSSFIRIGKSPTAQEKKASSFVRIGKSKETKSLSAFETFSPSTEIQTLVEQPMSSKLKNRYSFYNNPEFKNSGTSNFYVPGYLVKSQSKEFFSFLPFEINNSDLDEK